MVASVGGQKEERKAERNEKTASSVVVNRRPLFKKHSTGKNSLTFDCYDSKFTFKVLCVRMFPSPRCASSSCPDDTPVQTRTPVAAGYQD